MMAVVSMNLQVVGTEFVLKNEKDGPFRFPKFSLFMLSGSLIVAFLGGMGVQIQFFIIIKL